MKKRRRLKKGLAMLLSLAMVVGLMPGVGTMKVFAAGTTSASGGESNTDVTLTALYGYPAGNGGATYDKILDGETNTRWECDLKYPSYVIFKASAPINVNGYSMWTAHDTTGWSGWRNPKEWTLYGCNDYDEEANSGGTWKVIHTVTNGGLPNTNAAETKFTFDINKTTYQYFKLDITKINQFEVLRLGEFALTYCDHTWGSPIETLEPTCIDEGCKVYQCSICQTTKRESTGNPALGHDFINGVCSRCNNGSTEPTEPEKKTGYTR